MAQNADTRGIVLILPMGRLGMHKKMPFFTSNVVQRVCDGHSF